MLTASTRLCVYFLPNANAHIHATTCSLTERTSRSILPSLGWVVEERICSLKSVHRFDCSVRNAFSDAQRVHGFCEWGLRQRDVLASAYLFHTLFNSLVFLFSCRLCLPKPSAPLSASARGVWWGSVDRDGWVKMCRWISAKPAEGWGRRGSLFFVDEKRHWISSTSAWHQGTSQAASSPWLY